MENYNKWPKEDLIKKLMRLEAQIKSQAWNEAQKGSASEETEAGAAAETPAPERQRSVPGPVQKKKTNDLDPTKYRTRFIALKLAYLGKRYNGFEYQSQGKLSTIEEELWKALVKARLIFPNPDKPNEVDWTVCDYTKCGRTDRGVSAFGQVIALRVRSMERVEDTQQGTEEGKGEQDEGDEAAAAAAPPPPPPPAATKEIQYCHVLNRILPSDIRVYAWCPNPPPDFSARFSCRERQYRYFFTQPAFSPLPKYLEPQNKKKTDDTTTQAPRNGWLDIDAMRKAAKLFEGLHDFRNFCKVDASKQITNFLRRIHEADIVEVPDVASTLPYLSDPQLTDPRITANDPSGGGASSYPKVYYFHVRGSAFLWHQIRCMVSILFLVGQGYESPAVINELLDVAAHPQRPNYKLADDAPLVLWDCLFGRNGAADDVEWEHVGGEHDDDRNAGLVLVRDLWATWRERKMDEILANRLAEMVAQKTRAGTDEAMAGTTAKKQKSSRAVRTVQVFEGGDRPRPGGSYIPLWKKELVADPDVQNDKYAQRMGFANSEAMKASGNWRAVIKAAKAGEAMDTTEN